MKDKEIAIIRPQNLADLLGISLCTLWRWEQNHKLPKSISLGGGRLKCWRVATINLWLEEQEAEK